MSANPAPRPLYDVGEAGCRSCSVDSNVRAEGPMSRTSYHHDPYYSPTSTVGQLRADRLKYLLGSTDTDRNPWERAEKIDPTAETVVDPDHEDEGALLLLDYYEAVRRDRHVRQLSLVSAFLGIGGLGVLIAWLTSNYLIGAAGLCLAMFVGYMFLTGSITLPGKAGAAKEALESSGYFRDISMLDGYLITTPSPAAVWEAIDLEERRRAVDYEAVRLSAHTHLTEHRQTEITQLQQQEQELRRLIVDMLDPQRPDSTNLSDETRAAFHSRRPFAPLSTESTQMMWSEGGEQR